MKKSFIHTLTFVDVCSSYAVMFDEGPAGATSDMGNIDIVGLQNGELSYIETIPAHTSVCQSLRIDPHFRKVYFVD